MSYDPSQYTRAEIDFPYSELPKRITEAEFAAHCQRMHQAFATLAKSWSPEANGEWLTRHYLAIKMIFGASVMLSSLDYALWRNLRVVEPYLLYYSAFNAARAWFLTLPNRNWGNGNGLLTPNHSLVRNVVKDEARHISGGLGEWVGELLGQAKVFRELFSYNFPTGGVEGVAAKSAVSQSDVVSAATLFSELAQANSDMLQRALTKHVTSPVGYSESFMQHVFRFQLADGKQVIDPEDRFRIRQMMQSGPFPSSFFVSIREGFVDDFFEAWENEDHDDESYDPREEARRIYPFP